MLRILLVIIVFLGLVAAVSAIFIPYIYFYKYNAGSNVGSRVFLASNYEGPPNVDSTNKTTEEINRERRGLIGQKLSMADFDRENVIILEEPSPISPQYGRGSVEVVLYLVERAIFKTSSSQPKLLFLRDPYYFGWHVKVDGQETRIFRANYSYRAVPITGGEHTVEFYYDSLVYKLGVIVGFLTLAILFFSRARSRS